MQIKQPKNPNYAALVVRINTLVPLENCDNVQAAIIFGNQVIVGKDIEPYEIGLYFPLECQLSKEFLSANNLYSKSELNSDITKKGYFDINGRIRCQKFRGHKSEGFFIPMDSLAFIYPPDPKRGYGGIGLSDYFEIGTSFDELEGINICKKYIVPVRYIGTPGNKKSKQPKETKLIENQFRFHLDTEMLYRNLHKIHPEDLISITYKIHGTSVIISKILCKKSLKWYEKILKKLGINIVDTQYDNIYASRKVIKNSDLNPNAEHFYSEDIWGIANDELKDFLQDGLTIYAEIAGFLPGGSSIQKHYDYGCIIGKHKTYIYRITYTNPSGKVFEWSAKQVQDWCKQNNLLAVPQLFYGFASHFSDERLTAEHWRSKFLQTIKDLYNEKDCYICSNKVPEEGCVIRIEKNEFEAYKAKSNAFYALETKLLDKNETNIEDDN